jgi:hypothetical protein
MRSQVWMDNAETRHEAAQNALRSANSLRVPPNINEKPARSFAAARDDEVKVTGQQ